MFDKINFTKREVGIIKIWIETLIDYINCYTDLFLRGSVQHVFLSQNLRYRRFLSNQTVILALGI